MKLGWWLYHIPYIPAPGRKFTRHATTMATMSTTVVPSSLGGGSAPLAREDFESSTSSAENSNNNPAASTAAADGAAGVAHSNNNMTTQLNESLNSTGGLSDMDLEDAKSSMVFTPGRLLEEELWFHGVLPRYGYTGSFFQRFFGGNV